MNRIPHNAKRIARDMTTRTYLHPRSPDPWYHRSPWNVMLFVGPIVLILGLVIWLSQKPASGLVMSLAPHDEQRWEEIRDKCVDRDWDSGYCLRRRTWVQEYIQPPMVQVVTLAGDEPGKRFVVWMSPETPRPETGEVLYFDETPVFYDRPKYEGKVSNVQVQTDGLAVGLKLMRALR